jgi:hypothetical protein
MHDTVMKRITTDSLIKCMVVRPKRIICKEGMILKIVFLQDSNAVTIYMIGDR